MSSTDSQFKKLKSKEVGEMPSILLIDRSECFLKEIMQLHCFIFCFACASSIQRKELVHLETLTLLDNNFN